MSPTASAARWAQRTRIVHATAQTAREAGIAGLSVTAIVARAGVSRRTFYEIFLDAQDCLRATFEESLARAAAAVLPAYRAGEGWRERIDAALAALLQFLEDQPRLGGFLILDSLAAGDAVLARRQEVFRTLVKAIDGGRRAGRPGAALSRMNAEGTVGGVLAILHARILAGEGHRLSRLHGELMAMIVRPYLGPAAAAAQRRRPAPRRPGARPAAGNTPPVREGNLSEASKLRLTDRTVIVINTIATLGARDPGPSNRQVADAAGIADQGQISKLLSRLQRLGLIANDGGPAKRGLPNRWTLTETGREVQALLGAADAH